MLAAGFDFSEPYLREVMEKAVERSLQVRPHTLLGLFNVSARKKSCP